MSSEVLYFCLMGLGWFFLAGWAVALIVACAIAFRQTPSAESGNPAKFSPLH